MSITAPIDKLTGTTQAGDIAVSFGPNEVWRDCYRVKAYNKWEKVQPFTHVSTWEFQQPMMVASYYTGESWDVTNRTFLGQLSECNLQCDFCYRGKPAGTVNVTPEEYVAAFLDYNVEYPADRAGVMRISGGETMLYQEWVVGVIDELKGIDSSKYIWVDTNLTLTPDKDMRDTFRYHKYCDEYDIPVGLVGCFKPGLFDLDEQLRIAKVFSECSDFYLSWSCGSEDTLTTAQFLSFLDELDAAIPYAPLRMYMQRINYSYDAVKELNTHDWDEKHRQAQMLVEMRRDEWSKWCANKYPVWMCNMPNHQIKIG